MKAGWMTMQLAFVATLAFLFVVGTSGAGPDEDSDGDGQQNSVDNCSDDVNPSQHDSNLDGYGNRCDADWNNDGTVGGPDFAILLAALLPLAETDLSRADEWSGWLVAHRRRRLSLPHQ